MITDITGLGTENTILTLIPNFDDYTVEILPQGLVLSFAGTFDIGYPFEDKGRRRISCSFTFTNRKELNDFIDFWYDRKGALKRFWIPCWFNEFKLVEPIEKSSSEAKVYLTNLALRNDEHLRVFLFIYKGDLSESELIVRKITDIVVDTENKIETLYFDNVVNRKIYPQEVTIFGRVLLVRFGETGIELQCFFARTNELHVKVSCNFLELPSEYEEIEGT